MTVEYDSEASAVMALLDDMGEFNEKVIDDVVRELVSDKAGGIITKRFERKIERQRTYIPLKKKTKILKERKKQKHVMTASGTMKDRLQKTMKGKINSRVIEFSASVPHYGLIHQKGEGRMPKREFFSFNDKHGQAQTADVNTFNKVAQQKLDKNLAKLGIQTRR